MTQTQALVVGLGLIAGHLLACWLLSRHTGAGFVDTALRSIGIQRGGGTGEDR